MAYDLTTFVSLKVLCILVFITLTHMGGGTVLSWFVCLLTQILYLNSIITKSKQATGLKFGIQSTRRRRKPWKFALWLHYSATCR